MSHPHKIFFNNKQMNNNNSFPIATNDELNSNDVVANNGVNFIPNNNGINAVPNNGVNFIPNNNGINVVPNNNGNTVVPNNNGINVVPNNNGNTVVPNNHGNKVVPNNTNNGKTDLSPLWWTLLSVGGFAVILSLIMVLVRNKRGAAKKNGAWLATFIVGAILVIVGAVMVTQM